MVTAFLKYWLPVVIWMGLIFTASTDAMSSGRTSRIIGPILRWLKPDISPETIHRVQHIVRKGAHVTEYALLAGLLWRALRKPVRRDPRPWRWKPALLAFAGAVAYAVTDEFHQTLVPTREGHIRDVAYDAAGAALGLLMIWSICLWAAHRRSGGRNQTSSLAKFSG